MCVCVSFEENCCFAQNHGPIFTAVVCVNLVKLKLSGFPDAPLIYTLQLVWGTLITFHVSRTWWRCRLTSDKATTATMHSSPNEKNTDGTENEQTEKRSERKCANACCTRHRRAHKSVYWRLEWKSQMLLALFLSVFSNDNNTTQCT